MTIDESTPVSCSGCGRTVPRGDMFGVEPDLLCEDCAEGVRKRLHVRFRPRAKEHLPRATAACLAIAVGLFVATAFLWPWRPPDGGRPGWLEALYQDEAIWAGALWKHLSAIFLHGNFIHILFNGFVLYTVGRVFERRWGTAAFLAVLLLTGMAGQAAQWIATGPAVGLSGGLLGLIGFLIARRRDDPVAGAIMHDGNVRFVLIYVVGCIVATQLGMLGFIANVAHVIGLGLGWLFGAASRHPARQSLLPAVGVLCLVVVVASLWLAFGEVTLTTGDVVSRQDWRLIWLRQQG